ncbi:prion-inhibition and propagation-domain-containing protein [Corynascus similis CBS 632.67]
MDPDAYITITHFAFQAACIAVKTFQNGLRFSKDAEKLVLSLELERFRLHIWGENAGLAPPEGEPPALHRRLLPICEILKNHLEQIQCLVNDADGLSNRYGLLPTQDAPTDSAVVQQLVNRMQQSIQLSRIKVAMRNSEKKVEGTTEGVNEHLAAQAALGPDDHGLSDVSRNRTSTWKRVRWAVRDLDKFDKLVKSLADRINKLHDLLSEADQRKSREDNYRVNLVIVGSAVDEESLELIRAAVRSEPDTSQVRTAVERKALTVGHDLAPDLSQSHHIVRIQSLSLSDFILPSGFSNLKRFVTVKTTDSASGTYYLLERKPFDPSILPVDMALLTSRIQRLVLLLQRNKSPDFRTPHAEGCIRDPANYCWWIVFRFPIQGTPSPQGPEISQVNTRRLLKQTRGAPVSLLSLLNPAAKFRPPLEQRFLLASTLCATLSELYLSGWLHKGVRSDNVLFPAAGVMLQPPLHSYTPEAMRHILSAPLICGFDYSRHESEWRTIDRARTSSDVPTALYRHPNYQGDAAEGYRVQYDVYSVGLVLVEIALWIPLASFLDAKKSSSLSLSSQASGVELSGEMKLFHSPHATELKRRVMSRVDSELAFRVGSSFCQAVKFCLEFGDIMPDAGAVDGGEVGVHPAMEFYDNVVVPLARLVN